MVQPSATPTDAKLDNPPACTQRGSDSAQVSAPNSTLGTAVTRSTPTQFIAPVPRKGNAHSYTQTLSSPERFRSHSGYSNFSDTLRRCRNSFNFTDQLRMQSSTLNRHYPTLTADVEF